MFKSDLALTLTLLRFLGLIWNYIMMNIYNYKSCKYSTLHS